MNIAIPVSNNKLCLHFGHCETFAFVEVDAKEKKVIKIKNLIPPPHEPGLLPRWLAQQGANLVIAGGMGARAQQLFEQAGIEVIVGAPAENVEFIVSEYLQSTLQTGVNTCDH